MQLRALNPKAQQKDNSDLLRKVELRRRVCRDVKRADVFLAGSGFGQMFRHAWRDIAGYTLALDTNQRKVDDFHFHFPSVDARVADFTTFTDWSPDNLFQIADFDAFGDVYPGILHFFATAPWQTPLHVVVGDSGPLAFKRAGAIPKCVRKAADRASCFGSRDLDSYMDRLVWPWWKRTAARHDLEIIARAWIGNREKTVAYYALKLGADYRANSY